MELTSDPSPYSQPTPSGSTNPFVVGTIAFNGAGATLKLDRPDAFYGSLTGLQYGDVIDFTSAQVASAGIANGVLTVSLQSGQTETFTVDKGFPAPDLVISGDGVGGSEITLVNKTPPVVSIAQFVANQATLDQSPLGFIIADSAANIANNLDALSADPHLVSIQLTDPGAPTLTVSLAQAQKDTSAIGKISSAYKLVVADVSTTLTKLTAPQIASLGAEGVSEIIVSNTASLVFTATQSAALISANITPAAQSGYIAEELLANGGYETFNNNGPLVKKTVNADGTYDIHYYQVGGTFQGVTYAGYDSAYTKAGAVTQQTYYDPSGNVLAYETFAANGGYAIVVGGQPFITKTVNADGTYDIHYYQKGGTFQGVTYAGYDNAYTKAGAVTQQTYYDASGNVLAYETFAANGGYAIVVGGQPLITKTVNADGTYDIHYYQKGGTFQGVTYAGYDNAYTGAGAITKQTYYDASSNVLAYETFAANGGYAIVVGGQPLITKTVNADGTYDIHYYQKGGTFQGVTYAGYDNAYTGAGAITKQTYYDASNNVLAYETFAANGGYAIVVGGQPLITKTVNADGTYDIHYYQKGGTFQGVAYAGYDTTYTKTGAVTQQTYYDASSNVLAYETFAGNGGYAIYVGGQLLQAKAVNSDGSYDLVNNNIKGQSCGSDEFIYSASGTLLAQAYDNTNGTGSLTLRAGGFTVTEAQGTQSVAIGVDTFQLTPHSSEFDYRGGRDDRGHIRVQPIVWPRPADGLQQRRHSRLQRGRLLLSFVDNQLVQYPVHQSRVQSERRQYDDHRQFQRHADLERRLAGDALR